MEFMRNRALHFNAVGPAVSNGRGERASLRYYGYANLLKRHDC